MTRDERLAVFYARHGIKLTEEEYRAENPPPEDEDRIPRYKMDFERGLRIHRSVVTTIQEFFDAHCVFIGEDACFMILEYLFTARGTAANKRLLLAQFLELLHSQSEGAKVWYIILLLPELWAKLPLRREDYYPPVLWQSASMLRDR